MNLNPRSASAFRRWALAPLQSLVLSCPDVTAGGHRRGRPVSRAVTSGLAAFVLLALVAAGCGGGSPGSHVAQLASTNPTKGSAGPTANGKFAASLSYSRCMRSHGVPNFPDPKQVGDDIQIPGSRSGMNPQSPVFESAQRSCRQLLPGGGQHTHAEQQHALARMLHISQCMRAHDISEFPDPTPSPPSSRAGHSEIMSNGEAWLAIPNSIDVRSLAFERAAVACNLS
jgi:hypothetical protein